MKRKFVLLAPAALFGTIAAFTPPTPILLTFLLYLFFLIKTKQFGFLDIIIVIGIFIVFFESGSNAIHENRTLLSGNESEFFLSFNAGAKIDGDSFMAEAVENKTGEHVIASYKIKTELEKEALERASFVGRNCRLRGQLELPSMRRNPGAFDYGEYLNKRHIHWIVKLDYAPLGNCGKAAAGIIEVLGKIRESGIKGMSGQLPKETVPVAAALLYGDQSLFTTEVSAAYRNLGITHLLAISGMQVTILAGLALYAGLRMGATRERISGLLILILPLYAILAGASPSVIRSVLMAEILLLANILPKSFPVSAADALSLSFAVYLIADSFVLFDPGFQLSYAVTFALLLSGRALKSMQGGGSAMLLSGTMVSQIAALPILLFHFYGIPLIGTAANLVYIPLYSFFMVPAVYSLYPLSFLGRLSESAAFFVNEGVILSERLAIFLAKTPILLNPGRMGLPLIWFYGAAVVFSLVVWEKAQPGKKAAAFLCIPVIILLLHVTIMRESPSAGEITMIDVGQGDSILIELPSHKGVYLIDTGGAVDFWKKEWQRRKNAFDPGKDTVIPLLKAKGITKIDKLILTHGDMDHIGGALAVVAEIDIEEIIIPSIQEKSELERTIIRLAAEKGIHIREAERGDYWQEGPYSFHVLSPREGYEGERNGGSLSIYTILGGKGWFFGGDLDEKGENEITGMAPSLRVDVLKAGHHGSKTSSSEQFLETYRPKIVLISAGVKNRFGHPNAETLGRFEEIGARVFRTDLHGAVTYTFNGNSGTFSTYLPYTGPSKEINKD
ncbi:DNA internalization-related competence protein ComEC/Rec2 [Neobacillus piezotolerans]|uniref:DNA internalization-related competence protein ComEC/Rec2 n=1 Tax=Neobacillus piezotolerans TaxID=2259171 RepID=A0A3D8GM23_9BACI|nr:DNA internalization-related competence protein ComEC/Rec2 [Neobacillus piezotolerans]RDU35448.1 DNA internalization-related competence protein ComEC/Rec2 [Neobacillus piezotolerans]